MTVSATPRRLTLRLLGAPQILVDDRAVETDTRKAIALLARLAVSGGPESRESIASLLWPEYDAAHAGAALRRTLSVTRNALGGRWLLPSGRLLQLEARDMRCDVTEFRAALASVREHHRSGAETGDALCDRCRRRLERAVDLHRGAFLEGFSLRDSLEFDDWQIATAAELRAELGSALQRLTDAAAAGGRVDSALRHARRWLMLDPLHEPAHRRMMELHAAAGDRAAALRQYRECVRVLDDELGVAPLPETTETYQRIAAGDVVAGPTPSPLPTVRRPDKPMPLPLVGRAVELARLAAVYDSSTERGRIAFVEGEAGIGKSRLADELAALVNANGGRVIATRGYRGESNLAYAPISDALSRAATGDAAWPASLPPRTVANVAQLVPEIGRGLDVTPQPAELDEEAARSRFLADLARCLEAALAGSPPGLLLVDDGQWLDDASVAVLAHLVRRIADLRMCIIVCERSDELVGDRLEGLKRDARRGGVLDEFVLERLGPDDVRSLASASGLAPDLGQVLFERSEGIPFFVVEYLELLRTGDGTSADAERLPQGIRDLVASRLEMVSAEAGQVLTSAAVIGRSFDGSLVRRASGRSADETVRALEELLRLGLVRERAASGDYDFDHEVTRDVLLSETSLARRRLLHRRIAEVLRERPSARSGQAAQIASHYAAAGDEREAAMYLRRAGKEAERLFANREALEHYAAALALDSTDATELHQRIGDLETLLGRYADAVASYESAAALAPPADLGQIEHQLAKVHHRRGEWALAETHYLAALSALPRTDANQRARVYADRSLTAHRRGDPDAARAFAGEALDLASAAGDSATLAQVHNLLGILAKAAGALDEARAQLEQSLERAVEHPGARIAAMNNLALVERAAEQPERAVELTRAALRLCVTLGDRHREAALRNNLADLLHAAGRADEAMAELRESVTIFTEIGEPGTMQPEIWKLVEW